MNDTVELDPVDVIAVLMPEAGEAGPREATVIVRDADGQVSIRQMDAAHVTVRRAARSGVFRPGKPIFDPVSRQVMGYEMEEVQSARI